MVDELKKFLPKKKWIVLAGEFKVNPPIDIEIENRRPHCIRLRLVKDEEGKLEKIVIE